MEEDIQRWFAEQGQRFLEKAGLRAGDVVLDFGCGRGCYTIPAARVVRTHGVVYAVDKNEVCLSELIREASLLKLENIIALRSIDQMSNLMLSLAPAVSRNGIVSIFCAAHELRGVRGHDKAAQGSGLRSSQPDGSATPS